MYYLIASSLHGPQGELIQLEHEIGLSGGRGGDCVKDGGDTLEKIVFCDIVICRVVTEKLLESFFNLLFLSLLEVQGDNLFETLEAPTIKQALTPCS